jgi:hypothetical protein
LAACARRAPGRLRPSPASAYSPHAGSDLVNSVPAVRLTVSTPNANVGLGPISSSFIVRPNETSISWFYKSGASPKRVRPLSQFRSNTAKVTLAAIRTGASIASGGGHRLSQAAGPRRVRQTLDSSRVGFSNRCRHDRTNDIVSPASWGNRVSADGGHVSA